ncbi:uncharacterized protein LOC113294160 [Papaver somniferum]|uniref:uncharacterized protein LOC113294160 n=1 Tax=Papaver somniferum TaxID=3469 RepID=UPI000E6FBCA4|nr:uncharacterized protein LOC113294160 [Papaver somniferum]
MTVKSLKTFKNLIEKLGYRNSMNVEDVLNYPEENEVTLLLSDEGIIKSVMGTDKDVKEDDESSTIESSLRNEDIRAAITLNNLLLSYEQTMPKTLTMTRKIRDEIQCDIDFSKKTEDN